MNVNLGDSFGSLGGEFEFSESLEKVDELFDSRLKNGPNNRKRYVIEKR